MSDFRELEWTDRTIKMQDVKELKVSSDCVDIAKHFEGFREEAYLDPVGIVTLGFGETQGVKMGDKITLKEASDRLIKRLEEDYGADVRRLVKVPLTQYMFDALVSLTYNIGVGNFANSTLLELLNGGDYENAAREIPKWRKANGKVLAGLENRREAELFLFLGKDWRLALEDD